MGRPEQTYTICCLRLVSFSATGVEWIPPAVRSGNAVAAAPADSALPSSGFTVCLAKPCPLSAAVSDAVVVEEGSAGSMVSDLLWPLAVLGITSEELP